MNRWLKKFVERTLGLLARLTLERHHPLVVGITGSVGKSSTKEAIAAVLNKSYTVRKSIGNYNNEIGLPLTILGLESAGRRPLHWIAVFLRSVWGLIVRRPYPQALVLEMGVDRPGDMKYLLEMVAPTIGVVTSVSASHLEHFETLGAIAKEKGRLVAVLSESGVAILNADDERVLKMTERTKAHIITYGLDDGAMVRAEHVKLIQEGTRIDGISFKLSYDGKSIPVRLPETIGRPQVSAALAGAAVGIAAKMNLVDIADGLTHFRPLPGRMTLLPGREGMRIIDDTYNASTVSTLAALAVVREIIAPRRVVILGDMLEIGPGAIEAHRALADSVIHSGASVFVGVGRYMQALADALRNTSFSAKGIFTFPDPETARRALPEIVRPEDLVLVKGSQGLRMEWLVEDLVAPSVDRGEMLCRQSVGWRSTPFTPPEEWPT